MRITHRILGLAVVGTLGLGAPVAAQQVHFAGTTAGCFYTTVSCTPGGLGDNVGGLSFFNGFFNAWTSTSGFLGIGNFPGDANTLGSFLLNGTTADYSGSNFLLQVVFSLPTVTPNNTIYTAALLGDVESNGVGGVNIHFSNPGTVYPFSGPDNTGTFTLSVADVNLTPGRLDAVAVTGFIRTTVTPEPGTTALFATGLAGLIPLVRLRRRKNDAAA
jgi:hypothetical protein